MYEAHDNHQPKIYKKYASRERNVNYTKSSPYKRIRTEKHYKNNEKTIPVGVFLDEINI